MKKLFLSIILITINASVFAEAIKLKNGVIVNGSIIGQTEYVLNVKTSYGTISLNQREIDSILPDLHRVLLKGGGEFVGTVIDLDEFNLSLRTDSGVVNIDVNNIASMEIYDYDEAEKQKKYVEQKVEAEAEAAAALAATTAKEDDSAAAAALAEAGSSIKSSGGLSFDEDLEKIFPSKPTVVQPTEIFNYRTHAAQSEAEAAAAAAAEEEEDDDRFVDPSEADIPIEQAKRKDTSKNYFAVHAGALSSGIKVDLSEYNLAEDYDISGTNIAISLEYKRRLSNRIWLGGSLGFGMLPKKTETVPAIGLNPTKEVETSGQLYQFDALLTYYINPQSLTRVYLLGGAGFSSMSVDINTKESNSDKTKSLSTSSFAGTAGIGIERSIQDVNLGLEVKGVFGSYGDEFKESRSVNLFTTIKVSWFF